MHVSNSSQSLMVVLTFIPGRRQLSYRITPTHKTPREMSSLGSDEEDAALEAAAQRNRRLDKVCRDYDMMAVVVLDEIPNETISQFLDANCKSLGHAFLWLVDTYDNLPDYTDTLIWGQTEVGRNWRSPFIDKSLDDAANFIKSIDIATKAVSRNYFAVLRRGLDEQNCQVLICKTPNEAVGRTEVQHTEYQPDKISSFFVAFDENNWQVMMEEDGQL